MTGAGRCARAAARGLLWVALLGPGVAVGGCATRAVDGPALLGTAEDLPTMVLATGAEGRDCARSLLGRGPEEASLRRAVAQALAEVPDATLLTDVTVETQSFVSGLYNRRCVRVRGTAAKVVRQIVLPMPPGHHGMH